MYKITLPDNCLVGNQDNGILPLQLHDNRLEPRHQILVGFPPRVSVGVLVLVTLEEFLVELVADVGVCHSIAGTCVYFVQCLPSKNAEDDHCMQNKIASSADPKYLS